MKHTVLLSLPMYSCLLLPAVSKTTKELLLEWDRSDDKAVSVAEDLRMPQFELKKIRPTRCHEANHMGESVSSHFNMYLGTQIPSVENVQNTCLSQLLHDNSEENKLAFFALALYSLLRECQSCPRRGGQKRAFKKRK